MLTIGGLIWVVAMLYLFGIMQWNWHAYELYLERISKPWRKSIERRDWEACDYWKALAEYHPLRKNRIMFNPLAWARYWNWKPVGPPPKVSDPQHAGILQWRRYPKKTCRNGSRFSP